MPAESPAQQKEQSIFIYTNRDIFEDDPPPVPASPSLYGMSQLIADVNVPTQEDPRVPARSPRTEAALQPVSLDWNAGVEHNTPLPPLLEEEEQDVGLYQDPCLPSPPAEPISL